MRCRHARIRGHGRVRRRQAPSLALVDRLSDGATTHYRITPFDREGRQRAEPADVRAGSTGRVTFPLTCATDHEGYTILRIETLRPGYARTTEVHVARDPSSHEPRVIGIRRL